MRRVICYNQGEYAQYNFLAAELHKALRISPNDVATRQVHCELLEASLDTNLERVAQRNFQFITEYFLGRHEISPRVCIKANYNEGTRTYIVQVVRSNKVNYLSECPVEENSGFQFVKRHGLHFLHNNIPEGVATGTYENARIDVRKARAYWQTRKQQPTTISHDTGFAWDEEWVNCWETPEQEDGPRDQTSCYKSTLIIPMTLVNNELHPTFLDKIKIKTREEVSRLIFGYLCIDHIEEEYFKEGIDIDVGYMFADILSLYMISRATHTEFSETYREARTETLAR